MTAQNEFMTYLFAQCISGRVGFFEPPFSYSVEGARPLVEHHTAHMHTPEDEQRVYRDGLRVHIRRGLSPFWPRTCPGF